MTQDILITPKSGEPQIKFNSSGPVSPVNLNVISGASPVPSIAAAGSGVTSVVFDGTQGRLLEINDNLSSGTIFHVSDSAGFPFFEINASGDVKLAEYGRDVLSSGLVVVATGMEIQRNTPSVTTDKLYNIGGNLYFNGTAVGAGSATITGSGTANYVPRFSGVTSIATGLIFDNGTSVGILTSSPDSNFLLDVRGKQTINTNSSQAFVVANASSNDVLRVNTAGTTAAKLQILNEPNQTDPHWITCTSFGGSAGDVFIVTSSGDVGINNKDPEGQLHVVNNLSTDVGLIVEGAASQSEDLQQWQNSTGTVMTSINANGDIDTTGNVSVSGDVNLTGNLQLGGYINDASLVQFRISNSPKMQIQSSNVELRGPFLRFAASDGTDKVTLSYVDTDILAVKSNDNSALAAIYGATGQFSASLISSGTIESTGLVTAATGIALQRNTPSSTTDKLYNVGGSLYFNGSAVGGGGGGSYTAGTGLVLVGNEFNTAGTGYFEKLGVGTGTPTYTLDVAGNAGFDEYIYHNGDSDTSIRFQDDLIDLRAGNWSMIKIDQDNNKITINNSNNDVDFRVNSDDGTQLIRTDAGNNYVGIGTGTPAYLLDVAGTGRFQSDILSSGLIVGATGVTLQRNTPATTTDKLYNVGGGLYFNGSGYPTTTYVNTVSGTLQTGINSLNTATGLLNADVSALETATGLLNTKTTALSGVIYNGNPSGVAVFGDDGVLTSGDGFTYASANRGITLDGSTSSTVTDCSGINMVTNGGSHSLEVDGNIQELKSYNRTKIYVSTTEVFDSKASAGVEIANAVPHFNRGITVYPLAAGYKGVVIKGRSSQSANLTEWQNSAGTVLASIAADGSITNSGNISTSGNLQVRGNIIGTDATDVPITVQAAASQSANMAEFKKSDGKVLTSITSDGSISVGTGNIHIYNPTESGINDTNYERLEISFDSNVAKIKAAKGGDGSSRALTLDSSSQVNLKYNNSNRLSVGSSAITLYNTLSPSTDLNSNIGETDKRFNKGFIKELETSGVQTSGMLLHSHVPSSTTNKLYNDGGTLKFNGSAVGGGSSYTAGSGLTLDGTEFNIFGGTGNFRQIDVTSTTKVTPKIVFTGSGVNDTPINLEVLSSFASASTSGTALSFEGTQGQLFSITDNLSSGTIFSVNDITGLSLIEVDASGDVSIGKNARYVSVGTGVADFDFEVFASGKFHNGVTLVDKTPSTTTNTLYNSGGGLYFNGSLVSGSGDITNVVAGDGLNGGGTAGSVTVNVDAAQTTLTSIYNTALVVGYGASHANIDFGTDNSIVFDIDGTSQIQLDDGVLKPTTDSDVDLGTSSLYFKDAFIDTTNTTTANISGLIRTHSGIQIDAITPTSTTNKLYNTGGSVAPVKYNGSGIPFTDPETSASGVKNMMVMTEAVYTALGSKDANTLYFLV